MAQTVSAHTVPYIFVHVQVHGPKRVGCNVSSQEVNRCHTRGDSEKSTAPSRVSIHIISEDVRSVAEMI